MEIKISNKFIGGGYPCFIIAEAGVNHNGDLNLAKKLINKAKEAGVDAIKFQTFKTENLVTPDADQAKYQSENIGKKETVDLTRLGEAEGQVSRLQVAEIIEARVIEILDLVNKELKKIDRAGLLPAGVVLVGGGAKLSGLVELTKEKLKLPVQIGYPQGLEGIIDQIDDPEFATCCGLILSALSDDVKPEGRSPLGNLVDNLGPTVNKIKKWIKGFAP